MTASNPQKMLVAALDQPVYRGCHSPFTRLVRRCDDSKTPLFNRCLVGAVSVLRGGLAPELSPCRADRSRQRSAPLLRRHGRIL